MFLFCVEVGKSAMNQLLEEYQSMHKYGQFFLALERLLTLEIVEARAALREAKQLVAETLHAERVDIFLHDPLAATLIELETSDAPSEKRLRSQGLNRLPLLHGGYPAKVFLDGFCSLTGHLDREPEHLPGMTSHEGLSIRSEMVVALEVNDERRGVLVAASRIADFFSEQDLQFLEVVARWIGIIIHRAELIEQVKNEQVQPRTALRLLLGKSLSARKVVVGDIVLDVDTRQAWRGGCVLVLTRREYDLLEVLARNAGRVLTKERIFERVWGYNSEAGLEVIKVYMNYLRAKLNAGGKRELIHTIRGVDYVLKA